MALPTKVALHMGDVHATVKLLTAFEKEGSNLKMVCDTDEQGKKHTPAAVHSPSVCDHCGRKGSHYTFPRGREVDGKLVVISADELKTTKGEPIKDLSLTPYPLKSVLENTFPGEAQYLLIPSDAVSVESWALVRQVLLDNPKIALVTTFAVTSSNKMWRVGVFENGLMLSELAWPESLKARPVLPRVEPEGALRELLNDWVNLFTEDFDPAKYRDEAKAAREALVAAKLSTAAPIQPLPGQVPANVSTSLLERLAASVAAAKALKEADKPAAKKTAAKRTVAKKAVAKKAAPRKTA